MTSDAIWPPGTLGTDSHTTHTKTGIVPLRIDVGAKTMQFPERTYGFVGNATSRVSYPSLASSWEAPNRLFDL